MKCFHFSIGDRKEEPVPRTHINSTSSGSSNRKSIWTRSLSGGSTTDGRRYSSDVNSDMSMSIGSPKMMSQRLSQSQSQSHNLRAFSYVELKVATRNFSRHLMLGEGGFGCVYRGWIKGLEDPDSKLEVAVKQLNRKGLQGHKEWVTEVHFLGLVEHPHLVKLVGYCAEDDERGIQRLLVYEFMPNKSLEDHLFGRALPVLPWMVRLQVALEAARGLAYLHEEMDFQIIFRDLKTSNILLDEEFHPKLSDFGLARQGPAGGVSHVSTAVVGTVGYAAPEYVQTGHLTSKSDVWSFGVVLYELITGRRSMDRNRPKNEQKLLEWVKSYISDSKKFYTIIDPRLEGEYSLKSAQKLASLASSCLVRHPKSRPKMSEVVETLKQIVETTAAESPQLTTDCPTIEQSTDNLTRGEPPKGTVHSKRRMLLLKDMINIRSKENGRHTWRVWTPKMVRSW